MYLALLKNRISRRSSNGFLCNLCGIEVADEEKIHLHINNDESHLSHMTSSATRNLKIDEETSSQLILDGIAPLSPKEYECTLCACRLTKLDLVFEHISGKKHKKNRSTILQDSNGMATREKPSSTAETQSHRESPSHESNEETLEINREQVVSAHHKETIEEKVCDGETYKTNGEEETHSSNPNQWSSPSIPCPYCNSHFKSVLLFSYHSMLHLSQKNCFISDVINFFVKGSMKNIYCLVCDLIMRSEEVFESHVLSSCHQNRMMILHRPDSGILLNMLQQFSSVYPVGFPYQLNVFNGVLPLPVSGPVTHCFGNQHMPNVHGFNQQFQQGIHLNNVTSHFPMYFCFICNLNFVDENSIVLHCHSDSVHKYRMASIHYIVKDRHMKFVSYPNKEVLRCMKCQIEFNDLHSASTHVFDLNHICENFTPLPLMVTNAQIVSNIAIPSILYKCPVCKLEAPSDVVMAQHLMSTLHKIRVKEYYASVHGDSFEKLIFSCSPCGMNFFHDKELLEHFYRFHSSTCKDLKLQNGEAPDFNNCPRSSDDIAHPTLNEALGNLVSLELKGDQQQRQINSQDHLNSREGGKETDVKKNRTKNLITFSPRYVKLCLDTGEENIFRIHPERMRKLKLGISLTYPHEANRGCIPCGYEISSELQLLYEHLRTEEHERNLQEMEENDEFFENHPDQFSDLDLAKSYMHEDAEEWINCLPCNMKVENVDMKIEAHINSESHIIRHQLWKESADEIFDIFNNMFENLWYYIEKFFCNICSRQFDFEVDYARHLENSEHLKEVEKRIVRGQVMAFDCCILCSSFWYAISDHHSIHCSKDSHKYILKTRDFTVPNMPDLAKNMLDAVDKIADDLVTESDNTVLHGKKTEERLLNSIKQVVESKYPNVRAYLFGSRVSSLSFPDGDLDIFLDCQGDYEVSKPDDDSIEQIITVQECFHKFQEIWMIEEIIIKTRVPIIKLRHRSTNLNCDISFNNGLSVEKSKILGYFVEAYPPCRKLILFLKRWCNLCRLTGKKNFTSFAISWLVIFFLQMKNILPSVQCLIELENKSHLVAGWETGVSKSIPVQDRDCDIRELLSGFFSYYSKFDYISDVICPFLGKVLKKSQFSDIDHLPEEMHIYKSQIRRENIEFFRLDSPMCIQEPIDLSQNLTKAVTKLHLRMFREYCARSAEYLTNCS